MEQTMSRKILMILTSHALMGDTGQATGFWAEEVATPYFALVDAGAVVHLASPQGGAVPVDPGSLKPRGSNAPIVERFLADGKLQAELKQTQRASAVDAGSYDAVFFPGGHGTMWDLPTDPGVTRAVEAAYAGNKIIATVCHGASALVTAKGPDGLSVVRGVRINAFTDAEEAEVGLNGVVPFHLESRLRALGARFESAPNWAAFAIHDGRFITGQNPQSSELVAQLVLKALDLVSLRAAA
jgi:putative intracellular protease/amidase